MSHLLIIGRAQFGYLTDSYKWCENLNGRFEITYLCYDYGHERMEIPGVRVIYISRKGAKTRRAIRFLRAAIWHIARMNCPTIVIHFPLCGILPQIFPWKRIGLDIRTLSVHDDPATRASDNRKIRHDCAKYSVVSAISPQVIQHLDRDGIYELPLGADTISHASKTYNDSIRILYVGTFTRRHIDQLLDGVLQFAKKHPDIPLTMDLIGFSDENASMEIIMKKLSDPILSRIVTYHGRIRYTSLKPFFERANVGISFVPITEYFDPQPPTKTFEYALSGLYVIATGTTANKQIITPDNGIVIDDTPDGVVQGLEHYCAIRDRLDERNIRESLKEHTWANICKRYLTPVIDSLS